MEHFSLKRVCHMGCEAFKRRMAGSVAVTIVTLIRLCKVLLLMVLKRIKLI